MSDNQMDPALQEILDDMHALAAAGKVGSTTALETKLLLYIQDRVIQAYNLGVARARWRMTQHFIASAGTAPDGTAPPPIPQWLLDMGVVA